MDKTGKTFKFDYPKQFVTLPEYSAHRGQTVTVLRQLTDEECDPEQQPMWLVAAVDGWQGHVFDDELQ